MIRHWILTAVALTSLACAVRIERAGNERLLDPSFDWRAGETTAEQVARDLGPPDEIRPRGDGLGFVYRFERRVHSTFVLSYLLKLLARESEGLQARVLFVWFDRGSRLREYHVLAPLDATGLHTGSGSRR